jgi:hypothetical protein
MSEVKTNGVKTNKFEKIAFLSFFGADSFPVHLVDYKFNEYDSSYFSLVVYTFDEFSFESSFGGFSLQSKNMWFSDKNFLDLHRASFSLEDVGKDMMTLNLFMQNMKNKDGSPYADRLKIMKDTFCKGRVSYFMSSGFGFRPDNRLEFKDTKGLTGLTNFMTELYPKACNLPEQIGLELSRLRGSLNHLNETPRPKSISYCEEDYFNKGDNKEKLKEKYKKLKEELDKFN